MFDIEFNTTTTDILAIGLSTGNTLQIYQFVPSAPVMSNRMNQLFTIASPSILELNWSPDGTSLATALANTTSETNLRTYHFTTNPYTFVLASGYTIAGSCSGGAEGACNGIKWNLSGSAIVFGTENTGNSCVFVYSGDASYNPNNFLLYCSIPTTCYTFSDLVLRLQSDVCFNNLCITFSGHSIIQGAVIV